jgi:hypothetical protein
MCLFLAENDDFISFPSFFKVVARMLLFTSRGSGLLYFFLRAVDFLALLLASATAILPAIIMLFKSSLLRALEPEASFGLRYVFLILL